MHRSQNGQRKVFWLYKYEFGLYKQRMAIEELMRYFTLLFIFLAGCSTPKIQEPMMVFECTIFGGHGTYGRIYPGSFRSEKDAEESAEKVRQCLVKEEKIPEETSVLCRPMGTEQ
jgi:hypothetical protein